MAYLVVTQAANYATTPVGINATQRSSIAGFKTQNIRWFQEKSSSAGLKIKKPHLSSSSSGTGQFRVSVALKEIATEPEVEGKISVSPLSLEGAKEPPPVKYTPENPYEATVVSVEELAYPPRETCHIILRHGGNFPSWEGQYLGVVLPGSKKETFFSIASSRYGDEYNGKTLSLCVRRKPDAEAANYLCDRKVGENVSITGPYISTPPDVPGEIPNMLLPYPLDQNATFIMVATGVGVAPFRAHLRRLFMEDIPNLQFNGLAWLFHGVANPNCLLYNKEFTQYRGDYPNNFLYNWALSEVDRNSRGEKMYIQDTIYEHGEEIIRYLDKGGIIFFCGWKAMMPKIVAAFEQVCKDSGLNWDKKLKQYKENKQWHVQVY